MKVNSSPYSIDWNQYESLPKGQGFAGLDVASLQQRLNKGRGTPLRWRRAGFRCPVDATDGQRWRIMEQAVKTFIAVMAKDGWELRSKITVLDSAYPALELSDKPEDTKEIQGYKEYVVKGLFEKVNIQPLRIELPTELLGQNS